MLKCENIIEEEKQILGEAMPRFSDKPNYFVFDSLFFLSAFLQAAATIPESARSARALGRTISWLNISVSSHTRSFERHEPRKVKITAIAA